MKLTKVSVLFSSLYFGLVANAFSATKSLKMEFVETITSECGIQVPSRLRGGISFRAEVDDASDYVSFTPTNTNTSVKEASIKITEFEGDVTLHDGTAVANDKIGLWVGNASSGADFSRKHSHAGENFSAGKAIVWDNGVELHIAAVVDYTKSQVAHNVEHSVAATIQVDCPQ